MCGRYTNSAVAADIERRFEVESIPARGAGRFNVAPGQDVLAIVADSRGRRAEMMRWGLIPTWASDPSVGFKMLNARAETVLEKSSYAPLVASSSQHALVIADGFYEWLVAEDRRAPRTPVRFTLATGQPFAFAGLWTSWRSDSGHQLNSLTIVTTTPNDLVAPVHDRMPAILADPAAEDVWLDPGVDGRAACDLLRPLPSFLMRAARASAMVNSVRNEGPQLLEDQLQLAA